MRLLFFTPFYPPHTGGLEKYSANLIRALLKKEGLRLTVVTSKLPASARTVEEKENLTILRYPSFEIIPNYPLPQFWNPVFYQIFRRIIRKQFDLLLSNTRFFNNTLLAACLARCQKIKWIHIEHGSDFVQLHNPFFRFLAYLYDWTLGRLILRRAGKVITVSKAAYQFVKKLAQRESQVCYPGFDLASFDAIKPAPRLNPQTQEFITPEIPIIISLGRLIDGKGVGDLIEAFKKVSQENRALLFIIGDGPKRQALETLSRNLNLNSKVFFLGQKAFREATALLKMGDIFINPSYTEGMPTAVIEAALAAKTIIATDVGGTQEIITNKESGLLFKPGDQKELVTLINQVLADPSLQERLSLNARVSNLHKFNWESTLNSILSVR